MKKIKYADNVVNIEEARKKKENKEIQEDYLINNDEFDYFTAESKIDEYYDGYIKKLKKEKNELKKQELFKNFLFKYNQFFNCIYDMMVRTIIKDSPLKDEINYAMTGSGKRLRPCLMYIAYKMFGGSDTLPIIKYMLAVELIHSFSLIHDDLPCMDNDELRRGKPSTWKKFGEARALLAGDAMISLANDLLNDNMFDILAMYSQAIDMDMFSDMSEEDKYLMYMSQSFENISSMKMVTKFTENMIYGQAKELDLQNKKDINEDDIKDLYMKKTSGLLNIAMFVGYQLSPIENIDFKLIEEMGNLMGIMYQIKDDIEDVTLSTEELGKPQNSDEKNNKLTYVALKGVDGAKEELIKMKKEFDDKMKMLEDCKIETIGLKNFVMYFLNK